MHPHSGVHRIYSSRERDFIPYDLWISDPSLQRVVILKDQLNKKSHESSAHLACESAGSIRTVAALAREDDCLQKYSQSLEIPMRRSTRNALWGNLLFALSQSLSFFVIALVYWYGADLVSRLEASTTAFFVALMVRNYAEFHLSSVLMSLRARRWAPFRPGTSSHLCQTYPQQAAQVLTSFTFSTQSPRSTQTPRLERFLTLRPPKDTFDLRTFVSNTRRVLRFLSSVISLWRLSLGHISQWSAPAVQGKALCKNYP